MYYKIINNCVDLDCTDFFKLNNQSVTRGHSYKLVKPICKTNFELGWFNCRAINAWNQLPQSVVTANSSVTFKRLLSACDLFNYCR